MITATPIMNVNAASDGTKEKASLESLGNLGTVNIGSKSESGTWLQTQVGERPVFCLDLGKACHTGYTYVATNSTITSDDSNKKNALKAKIGYWYDQTKKGSNKAWVSTDSNKVVMYDDTTKVELTKYMIASSVELQGCELEVTDKETGDVIDAWTSTEYSQVIEGKYVVGKTYILSESKHADGYATAIDVEFTVQDDGNVQKLTAVDIRIPDVPDTPQTGFMNDTTRTIISLLSLLLAAIPFLKELWEERKQDNKQVKIEKQIDEVIKNDKEESNRVKKLLKKNKDVVGFMI